MKNKLGQKNEIFIEYVTKEVLEENKKKLEDDGYLTSYLTFKNDTSVFVDFVQEKLGELVNKNFYNQFSSQINKEFVMFTYDSIIGELLGSNQDMYVYCSMDLLIKIYSAYNNDLKILQTPKAADYVKDNNVIVKDNSAKIYLYEAIFDYEDHEKIVKTYNEITYDIKQYYNNDDNVITYVGGIKINTNVE